MITNYQELPIREGMKKAIAEMGFTEMTEIQQKAIPLIMQVLELMHQENLPLRSATASGFNLADAGTLAAYEVTLNAS